MTYEYECTDRECGERWEMDQRITDEPESRCPKCGRPTARRLASGGSGFRLKGPGWGRDGY